ncbi:hypothetical protein [Roseobacter weihaiensis]|uniref:hypothetical protein n=1 Tax=Roseobacter weihaiensis TaxID=2763262 RepID=UPI001D0A0B58|nr:hypothetical protein [Roseobacter sp. H9]
MRRILYLGLICFAATARADAPQVATDIAPVHGLVSQVMQGVRGADLVIPPGVSHPMAT